MALDCSCSHKIFSLFFQQATRQFRLGLTSLMSAAKKKDLVVPPVPQRIKLVPVSHDGKQQHKGQVKGPHNEQELPHQRTPRNLEESKRKRHSSTKEGRSVFLLFFFFSSPKPSFWDQRFVCLDDLLQFPGIEQSVCNHRLRRDIAARERLGVLVEIDDPSLHVRLPTPLINRKRNMM